MNDEEITISLEALRGSEYNNTIMNDEESTKFWTALREKEYPFLAPLRESKLYSRGNNLYGHIIAENGIYGTTNMKLSYATDTDTDTDTMASVTMTMIKKSIALNNAGICCMESKNTIAAIEMRKNSIRTTRMMTRTVIDVDEFFVRFLPEQHDTGISWTAFRDLIRLPPIEELPLSLFFAGENIILSDEEGQLREAECSSFIGFLLPTYAFNLALAHHQHGCYLSLYGTSQDIHEHQEEEEEEAAALSRSSLRQYHFKCAGRLYESTLKLERRRSNNELNLLRKREHLNRNSSSSSNWFTPRIILACINNLAQLHYLMDNTVQSQRCYRQLRSAVANIYLRRQQANVNSTISDNREAGKDYLQYFWTSSNLGLLQHHYQTSSIQSSTTSVIAIPLSPTDDKSIAMVATNTVRRTNDVSNRKSSRKSTVASSSDEKAAAA
ncbi:hypothetical protein FRACYDRAFT_243762 [Fragilariopsis cylindrus CCMP1102]|uniref:Uncharacterized protein n=1 Tax=Fragilariopsis cylindrus CCMP1102 TaxID=635003 RepID=A0A1E7F2V9_9STRA|nr:hypothetical protein FRACYDRAFT_243762 [Fragilariopsis cylindrus CCMP1102]|eukprot:OEU12512.1 hypothetical protein FRACYDRAFT_243762 [Fragilariopsis cylindrus CCMP1102]